MASILDGVDQRTQLAGQNRLELLLFGLGANQPFGINVFKVQEVIQCPPLTKMPHSHPVVAGIANMRGHTISIIDLSAAIGCQAIEDPRDKFVIVTEYNKRVQGFLVDSVDRIININWEQVLPPPEGTFADSYLTAVTRVNEEIVEILDVEKVLKEVVGSPDTVSEGVIDMASDRHHQHVLVCDDSAIARKQVQRVLDQIGVEYTILNDGQAALDQLLAWLDEGEDIHRWLALIISDIEMPRLDGYSLTRAIRKNTRLADLKIILHTSLSGVFNKSMVKTVGADDFLPKWEPDTLAMIVQDMLTRHIEQNPHQQV